MSVQAMSWAIDNSEHKGGSLLVLIMIANHARSDGSGAWPSAETLAKECRMSERQIRRIIDDVLEPSGELVVERRPGRPHFYDLPFVRGEKGSDKMTGAPEDAGEGECPTYPGHSTDSTSDIAMSDEPRATVLEPSEPPTEVRRELAKPKPPRPRDLIFDAIATVCQIGEHPTKSEASMIGKAKREILATFPPAGDGLGIHDIGPEDVAAEILERGREAWRRWGGQPFTPAALTKHWSSLAVPAPARNGNGRGKKYDVTDAWNEIEEMMSHGAQRVENDQRAALRGVPGGERDAG